MTDPAQHAPPADRTPPATGFAAGTCVLTIRGEIPVEALLATDLLLTLGGGPPPLKPLRALRASASPGPIIRVTAGALGRDLPRRDLLVGADQPLACDGHLVPARLLADGEAILPEPTPARLLRIQLAAPDRIVIEGVAAAALPLESSAPLPEALLAALRAALAARRQAGGPQRAVAAMIDSLLPGLAPPHG
jgi:hypothetical protein